MEAGIYETRPEFVMALQFTGQNAMQLLDWVGEVCPVPGLEKSWHGRLLKDGDVSIPTSRGFLRVQRSDWVVRTRQGEVRVVKHDRFLATHKPMRGAA